MLKKTQGIVLNYLKYKETSIIVKIFTRELGLKSYLVHGVRTQGKGSKIALYQPLSLLDLVVYDKENSGLQRISEAKILHPHRLIPFDFARTSIALFMTEVINRSIYEGYQNDWLFDFLVESISTLDRQDCIVGHFPLVFLVEKAKYLGFAPETAGGFLVESVHHPFPAEEMVPALSYLESLIEDRFLCQFKISVAIRRKLLDHLLDFHSEHLDQASPIKSLPIIRQLMS